ncbi:MAG: hypothetical protein ACYDC1_23905, partial [Limisphaerales bacterium]
TSTNQVLFDEEFIRPNLPGYPQLRQVVAGINQTRQREALRGFQGQGVSRFGSLGRILATPELTVASPYISTNHLLSDVIVERIPQQVLSLLRADEPRFTVYAFGQALREAPNSIYLAPGVYNQLCTNYQVKGEFMTKSVVRIEGTAVEPRAVIESYNELTFE